jgi:hypothetical protein
VSDYLAYTLWWQCEERMPQELERRRVVQERLSERVQEQRLQEQERQEQDILGVSTETVTGEALEPTDSGRELENEFVDQ